MQEVPKHFGNRDDEMEQTPSEDNRTNFVAEWPGARDLYTPALTSSRKGVSKHLTALNN